MIKYSQENNKISITSKENFEQILAFVYLMVMEYVSEGIFVPSLNPPENNDFSPSETFLTQKHKLSYKKEVTLEINGNNEIILFFSTIEEANEFKEILSQTW